MGSFKGDIDIDVEVEVDLEVGVDIDGCFGCSKRLSKSVQVPFYGIEFYGIEADIVLTLQF